MSYLGRQPISGNFQVLDAIVATTTDTYALTKDAVAVFPQTPSNCIVSLNGVIQAPVSSYTISGSNIVFASALTGTDSIDFITVLGDVLSIGTPTDGTVTTAKLADSSVTLAKLTATGTKDATTFLRGDNTFDTPSGGKVLQVITATDETERSATSSSYVTGSNTLSVSITPSSASNKIYVTSTFEAGTSNMGGATAWFTLYRDSTNLGASSNEGFSRMFIAGLSGQPGIFNQTTQVLDSPSSTSALVYQVYMKGDGGAHTTYINKNNVKGTITAFEIQG
jgi:hypothetical protein